MEKISDKEYYKAKFEYEELMEIAISDIGEAGESPLTSAQNSLLKKASEIIAAYEAEAEEEEVVELDTVYWHEAGDRTDLIIHILQLLLEHPAISQTEELKDKVEHAQGILFEVYQGAMGKEFALLENASNTEEPFEVV